MDKQEATAFFDREVRGRFPTWKPEDVLIQDWIDWLGAFTVDTAKEAMKQHKFNSRYATPVLKEFYAIAKKLQYDKSPQSNTRECSMRWTKYEVRCTSGVKKGFRKTAAIKKEYAGNDDAEMGEAMKLTEFFKGRYGGEWEFVKLDARPSEAHSEAITKDLIPF